MKILIINGPNLNMLGKRDDRFYGVEPFDKILENLRETYDDMVIDYFQSNVEGEIISRIQAMLEEDYKGLLINAGAFSHYSLAIHDALLLLNIPKVEVHLSNIYLREEFRRKSVLTRACDGIIAGFKKDSYRLAVEYFRTKRRKKIGFK